MQAADVGATGRKGWKGGGAAIKWHVHMLGAAATAT